MRNEDGGRKREGRWGRDRAEDGEERTEDNAGGLSGRRTWSLLVPIIQVSFWRAEKLS